MIGICRKAGKRLTGINQLMSRIEQVMTTPLAARRKRPLFGSDVRKYLSANMTDNMLILVQSAALAAFYIEENGISDFAPSRCVATRHETGVNLYLEGIYNGQIIKFEETINVAFSA